MRGCMMSDCAKRLTGCYGGVDPKLTWDYA